jgi:hypothetical protein
MIECRLTRSGFLQLFVSEESDTVTPVSVHVRCSALELGALRDVLRDAAEAVSGERWEKLVFHSGVCCVVAYPPTETAVVVFKDTAARVSFKSLAGLSVRVAELRA